MPSIWLGLEKNVIACKRIMFAFVPCSVIIIMWNNQLNFNTHNSSVKHDGEHLLLAV